MTGPDWSTLHARAFGCGWIHKPVNETTSLSGYTAISRHPMMLLDGTYDLLLRSVTHDKHITFAVQSTAWTEVVRHTFSTVRQQTHKDMLSPQIRASESTLGAFCTPRPTPSAVRMHCWFAQG